MKHRRRRPLKQYFTKVSLVKEDNKQVDISPLKKINNKISKYTIIKNNLIDRYILLLQGNCSKHKEFLIKQEIEEATEIFNLLVNEKKRLILKLMKDI
tara:strand:- start:628 stop:921 length:294 start_codon:yes stop_codon:yes gene_type:complete